jgi:hypothetical protein
MVESDGNSVSYMYSVKGTWIKRNKISIKSQAAEINFFLSDIGCTKLDKIKNEDIKKEIIYIKKMKGSVIKKYVVVPFE